MQWGWSGANADSSSITANESEAWETSTESETKSGPACSGGGRALTDGESGLASAAAAGAPTITPCVPSELTFDQDTWA